MIVEYHKGVDVPQSLIASAMWQERVIGFKRWLYLKATPIMAIFAIQHAIRYNETQEHNPKYIMRGSSGLWAFENVPDHYKDGSWWERLIWVYSNHKDGFLGDKRGEWSAKRDGKEDTFLSKWLWTIRNPANALRQLDEYSIIPADCTEVHIWGDDHTIDNKTHDGGIDEGWWFIMAEYKGKKYYSYRAVKSHNGGKWAHNASIGFKLKPEHFDRRVTERKGWTSRITPFKFDD